MKASLLIPFLLLSTLFAQNRANDWYIGTQLGLGNAFRTLEARDFPTLAILGTFQNVEEPITGLNGGLVIGRRITNLLWIESGLQVNRLGTKTIIPVDSLINQPDPSLGKEVQLINHYYYLNIPLLVKFYAIEGKFRPFVFLGSQVNLGLAWRQIGKTIHYDGSVEKGVTSITGPTNPATFSLIGGGGVSFSLSDQLSLETRFFAQRDITPFANVNPISKLHYVAGNIGVLVNL